MDHYYYLEAIIPTETASTLELSAHTSFGCTGIEEFSIEEKKVDEILGERSYSGGDVPESVIDEVEFTLQSEMGNKKFYFNNFEQVSAFQLELKQNYNLESKIIKEEVKDWNEEWKKTYEPIWVGEKLEVIPQWYENYSSQAEHKLFIYPGMGFGTGSHETTFLCLKLFLDILGDLPYQKSCLDFGCGSGILGIAFSLIYEDISPVHYYDIDQVALKNTLQNMEINKREQKYAKLLLPNQRDEINRKYSLVFANILQNVLLAEAKYLANCVEVGGYLILSGLLKGQEQEVIANMTMENKNLLFVKTVTKNDWVAVLMACT